MHPYLNTAVKAARSAGKIIAQAMDRIDRIEIATKGTHNNYVTSVDRACEAEIIDIIKTAYPDHGILGEESGSIEGTNPQQVVWIIDPLDGTTNFVHGFPQFCVSIGVQIKGVMEHGVIYNPINNELFTASKGAGAQLDGRRIRVAECKDLKAALLGTGFAYEKTPEKIAAGLKRLGNILPHCSDVRRAGSAALDLAFVAAGRMDGYWEQGLKPWDCAAGALMVREAGGFVSDFAGKDQYLETGTIVAGSPKIYAALMELL